LNNTLVVEGFTFLGTQLLGTLQRCFRRRSAM